MEQRSIPVRQTAFNWQWGKILQRSGLLIFFIIVLGPLLALVVQALASLSSGHADWFALVLPTGRRFVLLLNSIGFAAAVAAGGIILGALGGLVLWRWDTGWRSYLRWLIIVLAPIPPYIHALAWNSSLFNVNSLLERWGLPGLPLQGWAAGWWVQLMALAPVAVGLALIGFKSVEPLMIDSARVMRSDFRSLLKIVLPLAAPALLAGGGVLFILSLLDYSVPSLFNLQVYSLEIFAEYSASAEPVRAFLLSFPLLVIAVAVILASLSSIKNAALNSSWRSSAWSAAPKWPEWLIVFQWLALIVLVAQICVPLVSLTSSAASGQNLGTAIFSVRSEIYFTFWINLVVALLSIPLALAVAWELVNSKKWQRWLWVLTVAPLAIPPSLTGIGLITIWNRSFLPQVYGSSWMLILAGLARFTPLAVIVMVAQLRRINPLLVDSARILRTSPWQMWRQIWLPMLAPGILASAGIVFAMNLGELGATLLVAPPGHTTLTVRIYNFLHYGASDTVAGLCLLMAVIILVVSALVALSFTRWSRFTSKPVARRK